jgi:Replication-relaxation
MGQLDAIGRATFHHIASQDAVCPTNREIRWLKHIERHGPQSSVYLYELTAATHRCKDTALRDMRKLRAGGFLSLPPQQRATERAEFNPYIYDLASNAKRWLADRGLAEPTVRPTGHWWHGYAVSCVTSAIDIAGARNEVRYIPAHEILARKGATFGIPVNGKLLIPDQFFALDYGGSYRAFLLEVDRGTEPVSSTAARKSYASSVAQYAEVLQRGLHRDHYGLKANLLVLWVFTSQLRARRFLELIQALPDDIAARILVSTVEGFGSTARPPQLLTKLFVEAWQTGAGSFASIES